MEQHAIPQQITSYEFKLVGEMTLKQFGKAAGGVILALLINASGLVFFIKWPLMAITAGGGLALAFLPFQDRPLDVWLGAFLKSIYAPTVFFYKKKKPLNWLDIDLTKSIKNESEEEELVLPQKEGDKVKEFINSLPSVGREVGTEDEAEMMEVEQKPPVSTRVETTSLDEGRLKQEKEERPDPAKSSVAAKPIILGPNKEKLEATGKAVFGEIPMPDIPDLPNLIVGMVVDRNKKIVEGAIIEVQDKEGNPSRVLKTNQLGQFKTLTQLSNGKYLVVTEKDGLDFDRVEIDLVGKIVKPIRIIAK